MKKASKILTLILVFVLVAGVFSGCAMFTRNVERYRGLVAVTVGDEDITVGKILDTFNNYYNTYYAYLGQGITVDYLLQMTMSSLVSQYMKIDSYVKSNADKNTDISPDLIDYCHNAKYLTQEEMEYVIRYVKYLTFQTFDNSVINQLSANRTIGDEEQPDTSRDFTELDDLEGYNYSEYYYRNRVFSEDADEYFEKNYDGVTIALNSNVDEYINASDTVLNAILVKLNDRLDEDDEKITLDELKTARESVVKQYRRNVQTTYSISFEQFMINQAADMVASIIVAKYDYSVNKVIDGENLNATLDTLKNNLKLNTDSQEAGFALNDNFVSFIEGLSSSSYIYTVPENYAGQYIYVKNILIPFTDHQKTTLSNLAKQLGGDTKNAKYIEKQNKFAAEVIAEDFTDKDDEGENKKFYNVFKLDETTGELMFNPEGELSAFNGDAMDADTFIEYMKRFNTDTAQHTAQYDYVVRVGDNLPADYTAKWVTEFVDAANVAWKAGVGHYALAISTYGVHIVYYTADVVAQDIDFTAQSILETFKPEYRLFKEYFSSQSSLLLSNNVEEMQKKYLDEDLIKVNKYFNTFLKDNGFKFDLIEFLTDED